MLIDKCQIFLQNYFSLLTYFPLQREESLWPIDLCLLPHNQGNFFLNITEGILSQPWTYSFNLIFL